MKNQQEIRFELLTEEYYNDFLSVCNNSAFAPLLLPNVYSPKLWGIVALQNKKLIGGWVGTLRGDKPFVKFLTKGVWFDSYPIFTDECFCDCCEPLMEFAKKQARKDKIVLFNLTHWVRQSVENKLINIPQKNATFLLDLKLPKEELWSKVDSKQRNIIRKAEKSEVDCLNVTGSESLAYLEQFQYLRQITQKRAIKNNSHTSMLLKSNMFFAEVLQKSTSHLFVAKYENKVVAVALMLQSEKTMYYYSGGSDIEINRKTGASSLLIWKAIEYAKDLNLSFFDMGGVPVLQDKSHPAYGVYSFKKSFGGEYKEFNSGKIIISSLKYKLVEFILKNRKFIRFISKNEK
jgi:hypothetical protein